MTTGAVEWRVAPPRVKPHLQGGDALAEGGHLSHTPPHQPLQERQEQRLSTIPHGDRHLEIMGRMRQLRIGRRLKWLGPRTGKLGQPPREQRPKP